jgi:hypothetical protein
MAGRSLDAAEVQVTWVGGASATSAGCLPLRGIQETVRARERWNCNGPLRHGRHLQRITRARETTNLS